MVWVLFIADYILEREASSPLALATSGVPLHAIAHCEIIPGANEAHGLDRWFRLKHECDKSCCRIHCEEPKNKQLEIR